MARARSFGNIRKLPSGRYQTRYRHLGKQIPADSTFANQTDARRWLATIEAGLQQSIELLYALRSLYAVQELLDADTFSRFVSSSIERHRELTALEWAPRVTHGERASFETSFSALYPSFEIVERDGESGVRRATVREFYYPIVMVEPVSGNEAVYGLDLTSDAIRRTAIEAAIECGEARASGLMKLVQSKNGEVGFLVAMAIVRDGATLPDGVLVAVYRALDVAAFAGTPDSGVSFRFSDVDPHADPLSFAVGESNNDPQITVKRQLSIAGRPWRVVAEASREYVSERRSREWLFVTGLGVLLTLVTGYGFRMSSIRSRAVTALVKSRTNELSQVNEDLERERAINIGRIEEVV